MQYRYKAVPFCATSDAYKFHGPVIAEELNRVIEEWGQKGWEYYRVDEVTTQTNMSLGSLFLGIITFGIYWYILARKRRINRGRVVIFRRPIDG